MNKKLRIVCCITLIVALGIGFFVGSEYTKYTIRKSFQEAFSGLGETFSNDTNDNEDLLKEESSKNMIKDKEEKKDGIKKEIISNLKKGQTETITGKYQGNDIEAEISLRDVAFIDEILPPEPRKSYYTYFPKQDNKTFVILYMNIKNTGGKSFDLNYVIKNAFESGCSSKAIFGGKYEYTADVVAELQKDSSGKYTYESSFIYVDPLESKEFIVAFSLPTEVKDKEAVVNLCLGDKKINLDFSEDVEQESIVSGWVSE